MKKYIMSEEEYEALERLFIESHYTEVLWLIQIDDEDCFVDFENDEVISFKDGLEILYDAGSNEICLENGCISQEEYDIVNSLFEKFNIKGQVMKMKFKVEMEIEVTEHDIETIIEMAGYGIGYWCDRAEVGEDYYKVHDEGNKWYNLSYDDILKGVELYIKNGNVPYNIIVVEDNKTVVDASMIDSCVADMIIQYACFGDIIYG